MGYTIMRSCFEIHPEQKKNPGCIIEHVYPIFTLIRIQFQASKRHDEKSTSRSHFRICVWPRWEAAVRTTDPRGLRRQDGQDGRRNDGAEGSRLVSTNYHDPDILYVGQICLEKANEESLINLSKLTKSKPTTTNASSKL